MREERKLHTGSPMNEKGIIIHPESNQRALEIGHREIVFLHLNIFDDTTTYQSVFDPLDSSKVSHHWSRAWKDAPLRENIHSIYPMNLFPGSHFPS